MAGDRFNVLMVCSGNLCRSPIAEQLLRARVDGLPIHVTSAGTIARNGDQMPEEAAVVCRGYGGDPSFHRSRLLTEEQLNDADLVLTAAREHRRAVVQMLPSTSRRTFTIREFGRLVRAIPGSERASLTDPWQLLEAVRALRGYVAPPENPDEDDIEDPYRRSLNVYEAVGARLDLEVGVIAEGLRPPDAGR